MAGWVDAVLHEHEQDKSSPRELWRNLSNSYETPLWARIFAGCFCPVVWHRRVLTLGSLAFRAVRTPVVLWSPTAIAAKQPHVLLFLPVKKFLAATPGLCDDHCTAVTLLVRLISFVCGCVRVPSGFNRCGELEPVYHHRQKASTQDAGEKRQNRRQHMGPALRLQLWARLSPRHGDPRYGSPQKKQRQGRGAKTQEDTNRPTFAARSGWWGQYAPHVLERNGEVDSYSTVWYLYSMRLSVFLFF